MGLMSTVKHAFKDDDKESTHSHHHKTHDVVGRPVASSTTVVEQQAAVPVVPVVATETVGTTGVVGEGLEGASVSRSATNVAAVPVAEYHADVTKTNIVKTNEPVVETQIKTNAPIIQREHHVEEVQEINPEIEVNKTGVAVQQIYQPVEDKRVYEEHETRVNPTQIKEHVEEISDEAAARYQSNANAIVASDVTKDTTRITHVNPANVTEHVHLTEVQEITPVIHREEKVNKTIHVNQKIVENYQLAPKVKEVVINAPMSIDEFKAKGGVVDADIATRNVREL